MNDVFKSFLSLSLSGSLLILILFLCRHLWKGRISRQWQYYIWLIVIARLLLPFAPETNLMGNVFRIADHTFFQTDSIPPQQGQNHDLNFENGSVPKPEHGGQEERKPLRRTSSSQPIQDIITLLASNIWLVWLVIAFILLIRKITVYQSFVRYVKAGRIFVSDIELLDRLAVLAGQAGIKKPVELCVNPLISSPLLIGFFRPCIVLPGADISEKDFRYTALHELTHFQRMDMFYKWLVQITVCLHWFNPLVSIMSREINKACEFSCDEAIIGKLEYSSIQEYGETLLDAMIRAGNYKESLASVTLNENKKLLKERLGAIMSYKKKSKLTAVLSIMLTAVLLCTAAFTGAYAAVPDEAVPVNAAENNTDSPVTGTVVINLSNSKDQKNLIHSSSFQASDGQVLTLDIKSDIKGAVNLFLFSPSNQEQRITIVGNNDTKTIQLSEGTWSYNCTGFFDSGTISILGTVTEAYATAMYSEPDHTAESSTASDETDPVVINLSSGKDKCLIHSSAFQASDGQVLTLDIKSNITGTVNLTLFSPSNQEQRITIGGHDDTKTIQLSEGIWSYNCTGFFDGGTVSIIGTIE